MTLCSDLIRSALKREEVRQVPEGFEGQWLGAGSTL